MSRSIWGARAIGAFWALHVGPLTTRSLGPEGAISSSLAAVGGTKSAITTPSLAAAARIRLRMRLPASQRRHRRPNGEARLPVSCWEEYSRRLREAPPL